MSDPLLDSHIAEAANAAAVHTEAVAKASEVAMHSVVTAALKEVLTQGDEGTKRLLIQKIPLLCTDVMTIKSDILKIKNDISWMRWLVMGIAGGIGLLALKALGV